MSKPLAPGDRVTLLAGDERGGWGVVKLITSPEEIHVSVYGGESRAFERRELRRQGGTRQPLAANVTQSLRRAGFVTSQFRTREGFRVKQRDDRVMVSADFDNDYDAAPAADAVEQALRDAGYRVEREPGKFLMHVVANEGEQA